MLFRLIQSVLIVLVVSSAVIVAIPLEDKTEIQNSINCKSLCENCGCMGFYCGEECICECGGDNDEDIHCLSTMQSNCKKLKFPFEVLIQGPSGNRFVRNALLFEQNNQQCLAPDARSKRSTIVIYRPQNRIRRQADDEADAAPESPSPAAAAAEAAREDPQVGAAQQDAANEPPIVGLPLLLPGLAIPAIKAKTTLTAAAIKARYNTALAKMRTRWALRNPFFVGSAQSVIVQPGYGEKDGGAKE